MLRRHRTERRDADEPPGRHQDLQAVSGRQVPAVGVRPHLPAPRRRRWRLHGQRRPGLPQGRPGRGRRRTQGVQRLVRHHRLQPGSGDLPDRRDAGRATRPVRRPATADGAEARRPVSRSTPPSTGWCTTRAGPTNWRPSSAAANPVAGPFFSFSTPEPTGVVAAIAPHRGSAAGSGLGGRADHHLRQRVRRDRRPARRRAPRSPWPRCWPPPTCPAGWSTFSPATACRDRPAPGRPRRRQRPRPDRRGRPTAHRAGAGGRRHGQAGLRPAGAPDFTAAPGTARLRAFLEIKTVWHPTGALSLAGGSAY